jgi:hypothetical protein
MPWAACSLAINQAVHRSWDNLFQERVPARFVKQLPALGWIVAENGANYIVFDTVAETFRFIHSPATYNLADDHLLEVNGALGISRMNYCRTTAELWVLKDYEAEVWSLKYRIKLPVEEMRNIANIHSFSGIVVSDNGDVLIHSSRSWHMFHCDSKGKLQQKFLWDQVFPRPTGHWFKESLVKHVFFQKQDCGRVRQQVSSVVSSVGWCI